MKKLLITIGAALSAGGMFGATADVAKALDEGFARLAETYEAPAWYKNAKFGIFAHYGPQCQPEFGDWYARNMYEKGGWQNQYHVRTYGDPKNYGFKEVIRDWKAEKWDPKKIAKFYREIGAKFVVSMANHHDNFDLWNSTYQPWNAVKLGPRRDMVGEWKKACEAEGLKWGVSVHASHAWCWYETARDYDGLLTKADGTGTWWGKLGLDPQELYAQNHAASKNSREWNWNPDAVTPPSDAYLAKFMARHKELIDRYQPEILYYDDAVAPFYPERTTGMELTEYFYTQTKARGGEPVCTAKFMGGVHARAMTRDVERGCPTKAVTPYWQTDTCIGEWHYHKDVYKNGSYKSADLVLRTLIEVVAKGGNLLLSIPINAAGEFDEKEIAVCREIGAWLARNGEAIYDTEPWTVWDEGPASEDPDADKIGEDFNENRRRKPGVGDICFTRHGDKVYAIVIGVPSAGDVRVIKSFAGQKVNKVSLLGAKEPIAWQQIADGLKVTFPALPDAATAVVLRVE